MNEEIEFDVITEPWNVMKIDDGTNIKFKIVLIRVYKQGIDQLGNVNFGFQTGAVLGAKPPDELIGKKDIEKIEDIGFSVTEEKWSEYKLKTSETLLIKPVPQQVNRSNMLDPLGQPFYAVNLQPVAKIKKK